MLRQANLWLGAVMVTLVVVSSASATVITLTGGDSTDGWVAPTSVAYAYAFNNDNSPVIQGVTFTGLGTGNTTGGGHVVLSTFSEYHSGDNPITSGTADDLAMGLLLQPFNYLWNINASLCTLTLSGLTTDQSYRIDLFSRPLDSTRTYSYTLNGADGDSFSTSGSALYVDEQTATAVSGQIVVNLSGTGNPTICGICVSPVPEPGTLVLLGMGLLSLLAYAWRRRR